jgi:hypothetical protein
MWVMPIGTRHGADHLIIRTPLLHAPFGGPRDTFVDERTGLGKWTMVLNLTGAYDQEVADRFLAWWRQVWYPTIQAMLLDHLRTLDVDQLKIVDRSIPISVDNEALRKSIKRRWFRSLREVPKRQRGWATPDLRLKLVSKQDGQAQVRSHVPSHIQRDDQVSAQIYCDGLAFSWSGSVSFYERWFATDLYDHRLE